MQWQETSHFGITQNHILLNTHFRHADDNNPKTRPLTIVTASVDRIQLLHQLYPDRDLTMRGILFSPSPLIPYKALQLTSASPPWKSKSKYLAKFPTPKNNRK